MNDTESRQTINRNLIESEYVSQEGMTTWCQGEFKIRIYLIVPTNLSTTPFTFNHTRFRQSEVSNQSYYKFIPGYHAGYQDTRISGYQDIMIS